MDEDTLLQQALAMSMEVLPVNCDAVCMVRVLRCSWSCL